MPHVAELPAVTCTNGPSRMFAWPFRLSPQQIMLPSSSVMPHAWFAISEAETLGVQSESPRRGRQAKRVSE